MLGVSTFLVSNLIGLKQTDAQRLLGYPDGYHCEFLLSFGYPADPSDLTRPLKAGGRRPLEDLVHRERW